MDEKNGLTARQQELLVKLKESTTKNITGTNLTIPTRVTEDNTNQLIDLLKPKWQPNEIIQMFHEEREKIVQRGNECKKLQAELNSVSKQITDLQDLYLYISPKTSQLLSKCKDIIQERNDLRDSYDKINFTLNKKEELRSILKRMPEIKNQVLSILNHVCQSYHAASNQQEPSQQQVPDGGISLDEYYGRFFAETRRVKELTSQLELCLAAGNTDELLLHLEEIYTLYFDVREQLIAPVFTRNLNRLVSKADRNYCDLLQQTCASLVRILRNEIQLFNQIFPSIDGSTVSTPTSTVLQPHQQHTSTSSITSIGYSEHPFKRQALSNFLELLCKNFYERLRPVIIHLNHLETLTELYKFIVETIRPEVLDDSFQTIMSMIAEDIQERMIYRTEVFIQESVLEYKPSSGDLAYPEKLELVPGGELRDYQSMWYPTVQRTVLALYYLNRVFDPMTFRELAQEVVLASFKSLDIAQRLVDDRHGGTKIEATLFLSKHLAIIRDQLQSYGIDKIQFLAPSKADPSSSELFEIDTSKLESMLALYHENQFNVSTGDSLWSQLNETIVSGTKWTLRATKMRQ